MMHNVINVDINRLPNQQLILLNALFIKSIVKIYRIKSNIIHYLNFLLDCQNTSSHNMRTE